MDRRPYKIRAGNRIWRDTLAFFRGRLVPLILAILGLIVSYFYGPVHWTVTFLFRSIVMVVLSYSIAFLGALIINTLRVPWLLDVESGAQIDALEARAQVAEAAANSRESRNSLVADLSKLMAEGKALGDQIPQLSGEQLAGWDSELESWKQRVESFMGTTGWHTEIVPFSQAGDRAEPVPGVIDIRWKRENRKRRMVLYSQKLEEIVHRRLP